MRNPFKALNLSPKGNLAFPDIYSAFQKQSWPVQSSAIDIDQIHNQTPPKQVRSKSKTQMVNIDFGSKHLFDGNRI